MTPKTVEINIKRLEYLLKLFSMSREELLEKVSEGLKKPLTEQDVFGSTIKFSTLKRIDKVFKKGLNFYFFEGELEQNGKSSIFFRKESLKSKLNLEAKRIINHFEEKQVKISLLNRFSNFYLERKLEIFSVNDSPKEVANLIREKFKLNDKEKKPLQYLKELIKMIAALNVYVFEFIDHPQKKEKTNIDGFFLKPNFIVIKKNSKYYSREIFSLMHEFAHYLLNNEEIANDVENLPEFSNLNRTEKWCNEFSFFFLAGDYSNVIDNLDPKQSTFDQIISEVSAKTQLSKYAIYTRLYLIDRISRDNYFKLKENYNHFLERQVAEEKLKKELSSKASEQKTFAIQKPIRSPLFEKTVLIAYYKNLLSEYEAIKILNLSNKEASRIFQ